MKYLCGILNSYLITWMVTNTALTTGTGLPQWKKFTVEEVPVPYAAPSAEGPLVDFVDQILAAKDADPHADVTALENEIDQLVYALYGLTKQEIAAVTRA